jgi:hypothetical protein
LLVAEPALVPRRPHLLLVAEPLPVLGRDVHPRRFRRGRWWMWGFGGHEAIVSVLGGKFWPGTRAGAVLLRRRAVLMPSTPFAYSDVVSRTFASSVSTFPQVSTISATGSIRGSSTKEGLFRD